MKTTPSFTWIGACLLAMVMAAPADAAISPDRANFDAASMEPFTWVLKKYDEQSFEGTKPGIWNPGAWADGAIQRIERIADGGDGKPAIRMVNVEGRPSGMYKPWTTVSLARGRWAAQVTYRKAGSKPAALVIGELEAKPKLELTPTGEAFKSVSLEFDITDDGAQVRPVFQHYVGNGEGEALYLRSFELERVGGISDAAKEAEQEALVEYQELVEVVAKKEAARRAAERKPIGDWVRPQYKPVPMAGPLQPPPVTGETYYTATDGDDQSGDGSIEKPWKTIQHGLNQLHPGDRLYVRGGEYQEKMLTFARSGRADAYITVAGYPGEEAKVLGGDGLAVFNFSPGSQWTPIILEERAYLVVRDLYIDAQNCNNAVRMHGPMMMDEYKDDPMGSRGHLPKSRGMRHNIWIVGCEITGGNGNESILGASYGAHDIVISNNYIHDTNGFNAYHFSDGTIVEWNLVRSVGRNGDDAGPLKVMSPGVMVRYNTVLDSYRSSTSKRPGWAPSSRGGSQWRFLQGVSGIYLDWAMETQRKDYYPPEIRPDDMTNYVYGNRVEGSNAGIYVFLSDDTEVFDNVVSDSAKTTRGGWVEGKPGNKWLEFVGPAGYGIAVTKSENVKVYNNIVYNNLRAGLAAQEAPGVEFFNNIVFGNELAQIHFRKVGDQSLFGHNIIIETEGQGPPVRRLDDDYATAEAFSEKYPHVLRDTRVIRPEPGQSPLMVAEQLLRGERTGEDRWAQTRAELLEAAEQEGVHDPNATVPQAPYDPTDSIQEPLAWAVPGVIECENYDVGGPGVSYHDTDLANEGGHYRQDQVDIKASESAGNGAVVGFTKDGEWLEYTIDVKQAGEYRPTLTYATPLQGKRVRLSINGTALPQVPQAGLPTTDSWDDLATYQFGTVELPKGDAVLRLTVLAGPVDLDRLTLGSVDPR